MSYDVQEQLVIDTLREKGELSGADLARETRYGSGTLYPVLARLEALGAVSSRWVDMDYSRRRLYRLSE